MIIRIAKELSSYVALILKYKTYTPENIEELWDKLCERNPQSIEMYIPYGWKHLALALDESLLQLDPGYLVAQVKEKFNGGRYYVDFSEDSLQETIEVMHKVIGMFEKLSQVTCAACGASVEREKSSFKLPYCQRCKGIL